ncbi:MAG: type II toxin-antitoxin system HicB family antitoxin [Planctomycetota bacterium]|nr:type II toxin-antitoxin system HicB family antitoxin [Planctomycetota bacterium]
MTITTERLKKTITKRPKRRALPLTAAYVPAKEGGYTAQILEAVSVYSQGETIEEARENLYAVVALMLEEAPHQFGRRPTSPPPGALLEKLFVVLPS